MMSEAVDTEYCGRTYCPGCEPEADEIEEILTVRWCDPHEPQRAGADDDRVIAGSFLSGTADAEGPTCKAFADLLRR